MAAFLIPSNCARCNKKGELSMVSLPVSNPKKKGKSIVFSYTPTIYICKSCIKSLNDWVGMEQKGMRGLRDGFLDLMSKGKVILRTPLGNLWFVKK